MNKIALLGSTGSIGRQTLDVVAANPDKFSITCLAAYENDILLEEQIECFRPAIAVLVEKNAATRLKRRYHGMTKILTGDEGLMEAAAYVHSTVVVTSMVGFAGLRPTMAAIEAGKNIALANKETLVAAGELVTRRAKEKGVSLLPIDSEHSAILQCLQGEKRESVNKLIITASGGPFRGFNREQLAKVSIADCLKHPNWSMGKKITIDSATLANKGLEVIEARWLYDICYDQIEVVIHPQSIIHSMVEFSDGAVMAQLGMPDMRIPIQYALSYPERLPSSFPKLDFSQISDLTFEAPDTETFPSLQNAYLAGRTGGSLPCVFNAANEIAVYAFLQGRIQFSDIPEVTKQTMENHQVIRQPDLNELYHADTWARQYAESLLQACAG